MSTRGLWLVAGMAMAALVGCGSESTGGAGTTAAVVVAGDGAKVSVPAGVAPAGVTLTVRKSTATTPQLPAWAGSSGDVFAFTPHGTSFAEPVTLQLPFTGAGDVVLRLDDESDTSWEIVEGATFADGIATVQVQSFSLYLVASRCQKLCDQGLKVCKLTTTQANGTCVSACQQSNTKISKACDALETKLFNCYLANGDAGQFNCASDALPTAANCAAESAAVAACLGGSSGGGSDAGSTDGSGGSDTGSPDAGSSSACPCFDKAGILQAIDDATKLSGGKPGVSVASGGAPSEYALCFHQKGGTPADFGKLDKLNWIVVTALDASDKEAYNGWFVAGPVDGKASCMAGKGDSGAPGGPAEKLSDALSADELAACIDVLVAVKADQSWTCGEQH